MPEGPSIVILKEQAAAFAGKKIARAEGSADVDKSRLVGQRIVALRSWGKHFLIELKSFSVRVHLLMFGTYRINQPKPDSTPKLSLLFDDGEELAFYTCAVVYVPGRLEDTYDWRTDIMSDRWDETHVRRLLRAMPDAWVCDALLDQSVFTGVGNIIKNEVLFRIRVHPLSIVSALPAAKLRALVAQARQYGFEFLAWKQAGVLKRHWLAHEKQVCPRCHIPFVLATLGKTKRRSFFCENCQKKYEQLALL